jgi:protein O-GlcNAc transferase
MLRMSTNVTSMNSNLALQLTARAMTLHQNGRFREAQQMYEQILRLNPRHFDALRMMGRLAIQGRNPKAAVELYGQALDVYPTHIETLTELANLLLDEGYPQAAVAPLKTLIQADPKSAEAHNNLAHALSMTGDHANALVCFDAALALRPDYVLALANRGTTLRALGRHTEALESLQRALELQPDSQNLFSLSASIKSSLCDWRDWSSMSSALRQHVMDGKLAGPTLPFLTLFDDPALQRRAAEIWTHRFAPPNAALGEPPVRQSRSKIRIGYFSADFHEHATAHLIAEMLELHDKDQFEILAFSYGPDIRDPMRFRLAASGIEFMDVQRLSDFDLCRLARHKEIDIAVDLKGHTAGARPGIFALRPAPICISYLGYPGTMGAPYIDYLIADETLISLDDESQYAERILRIPGSYQINDRQRKIDETIGSRTELREREGLPPNAFAFACFNNHYKITPEVFDSWMRILQGVEGSVLWLPSGQPQAEENLRAEALRRHVDPSRLHFAARRPNPEHLTRHAAADLALDCWPYNSHTTASDALWAGLPMVTYAGRSFASRVGASLLQAVGLGELITHSAADFEHLAIELARDTPRLAKLRDRLGVRRAEHPLFDTPAKTRAIEAIYRSLLEKRA